ncbi:ABC transporter substrate-binding protein [Streptomyces paludis]|uniref:Extracellular solute-binding protein n=1 Tax=Streptomyces paludis TaxID=2282738 RepID=A0A345HUQ1_9ACTN|nr:extracellular solute-binding protein [Streptomyces paludis]AXG80425.1 extracellular solute-binding protein [Streptomyces paludis]
MALKSIRPRPGRSTASSPVRCPAVVAAAAVGALALAGCAPGSPAASPTGQGEVSLKLTSDKITIRIQDESGFPVSDDLAAEFTKQHPNVTFKVVRDSFANLTANAPRLLAGANAPDLIRLPTMGDTVRDGLLTNLDPYFKGYGWDKFPAGQLAPSRMSQEGVRGEGSLYQMGLGYSVTGIYVNQKYAEQLGLTGAPATIGELERWMAKAKAAKILPVQIGMQDGVGTFALQALINQYGDKSDLIDWMFNKPGATFDTEASLKGATVFKKWADAGYFPSDVNAINYTTMVSNFQAGKGLLMFNGNWDAAGTDKAMGQGAARFVLAPPAADGGPYVAMGAANSFSIPAKAKNADAAAFFLNWIHTDPKARQIVVDVTGASPGGDPSQPLPKVKDGSLIAQALAASAKVGSDDGFVDFMANTTAGIYAGAFQPDEQKLLTRRMEPKAFVAAIQEFYVKELAGS